ncbi:Crp/Fnr family transcriptional regulator [Polaromonas sp.]|uniref:Crp/Fnr family transcriptional regulator n=1 Tax=Polaromonas sp. TaxID=1869339 RepID=UPI002486F9B8|nr:Crp/Fnr family transcriptional regulator [Polaromonas sp.]MDI1338926.1 Crp/Fnr family transcriptional regulator [Polaromonas sp.]
MKITGGDASPGAAVEKVVAGLDASPLPPGKCSNCASYGICIMKDLSPEASVEAGLLIEEHSFRKGDLLLREGEHASHLRVIKVGTVYLGRIGSGGRINPVGIFGQGTIVGMCGYFGQPNQLAAVAATSGRCCEISAHAVASLARKDQKVWDQIGQAYCDTIGLLAKWTVAIRRPHIAGRVASSLCLLSEVHRSLTVPLPSHMALAHLLGTTRESVARALALLEVEGCITRQGGRVCAVMPAPLAQWLSRQP